MTREVAGDGEHAIMVGRIHQIDLGAQPPPEFGQALHHHFIGARRRRDDAPAALEQAGKAGIRSGFFGARNRMCGDDVHAGQGGAQHLQHAFFDRTDVAHHRIGRQFRANFGSDFGHGAHRHAQDDQIGIHHSRASAIGDIIGNAQFGHAFPHRRAGIAHRQLHGGHGFAHGAREA